MRSPHNGSGSTASRSPTNGTCRAGAIYKPPCSSPRVDWGVAMAAARNVHTSSLVRHALPTDSRRLVMKPAKILGHHIHPMLVVFPLGLLAISVIFDGVYLV